MCGGSDQDLYLLTHCDLVMPYGDIDLGQHWLRWWLGPVRHQSITWTNVDLSSVRFSGIHLRAISQKIHQPLISELVWKLTYLKFRSNLPGTNELSCKTFYSEILSNLYAPRLCWNIPIASKFDMWLNSNTAELPVKFLPVKVIGQL